MEIRLLLPLYFIVLGVILSSRGNPITNVKVTNTMVSIVKQEESLSAESKKFTFNKKTVEKESLKIQCTCELGDNSQLNNVKITWSGGLYPNDNFYSTEQITDGKKVISNLTLKAVDTKHENLFGEYTCECNLGANKDSAVGNVLCPPILPSFTTSLNVKEGGSKTISCLPIVYFNPNEDLKIDWEFKGQPLKPDNNLKLVNVSKFGVNIINGKLEINKIISKEHRGVYTCRVNTIVQNIAYNDTTMFFLRVKDPLAVLWPFIGICIEVVILVTIILVYERSRLRDKASAKLLEVDAQPATDNRPDTGISETDNIISKQPLQSIPEQPELTKLQSKEFVDIRKRVI